MKLLLFSGGVESTCLAAIHRPDLLLTIDYGQVCATGELRAAELIAKRLDLKQETLTVDLAALGIGDLAGKPPSSPSEVTEAWPFRNQMFITLAAMRYQRDGFTDIIIGTVESDSVHTDGTAKFIEAMSNVLACQQPTLRVTAPAINMSTLGLYHESRISRELLGWTFSCHRSNVACGQCRGCNKTLELISALNSS